MIGFLMTQLDEARNNQVTPLMKVIVGDEGVTEKFLLQGIKKGLIIIPANKKHNLRKPCAIGRGLRTKVNANIGTSTDNAALSEELDKLTACIHYGADTVMDLSVGGDIPKIRREIIAHSILPVGTVPIYEVAVNAQKKSGDCLNFTTDDCLDTLRAQAEDGVDFFTVHCGITQKTIAALKKKKRLLGVVSRGGAMVASWMAKNKKENPFFSHYDTILDIAQKYDVTLSLGDGLRPGSILDATDAAQLAELKTLGALARRARARGVQVMIEGPGHVPLNQIVKNMRLEKKFCNNAPFYVLGPLVTDVAAGYDHISAAIGASLAASYGADFLCYVTPAEHLRHPSVDDVKEGIIASRIAAYAADIVKGVKGALAWDKRMSEARKKRDWQTQIQLAIDPEKAKSYRESSTPSESDVCTMCGSYCSMRLMEKHAQ